MANKVCVKLAISSEMFINHMTGGKVVKDVNEGCRQGKWVSVLFG